MSIPCPPARNGPAICDLFIDSQRGMIDLDEGRKLFGIRATRIDFIAELEQLRRRAGADDLVTVLIKGHVQIDAVGNHAAPLVCPGFRDDLLWNIYFRPLMSLRQVRRLGSGP